MQQNVSLIKEFNTAKRNYRAHVALFIVSIIMIHVVWVAWRSNSLHEFFGKVGFVVIVVVLMCLSMHSSYLRLQNFREGLKAKLIEKITQKNNLKLKYQLKIPKNEFKYHFQKVLPEKITTFRSDDTIKGMSNGIKFMFCEVTYNAHRRQALGIISNWNVKSDIYMLRGKGLSTLNPKLVKLSKNDEVKLEHSKFSNDLKVFSNDQILARRILTPARIEAIINMLGSSIDALYVSDNRILIITDVEHDYFDIQKIKNPLDLSKYEDQIEKDIKNILNGVRKIAQI